MAELQRVKASTIRRILAGDAELLHGLISRSFGYGRAFVWHLTPQGGEFWRNELNRLVAGMGLSPEARAYLENLLTNGRRVGQ